MQYDAEDYIVCRMKTKSPIVEYHISPCEGLHHSELVILSRGKEEMIVPKISLVKIVKELLA